MDWTRKDVAQKKQPRPGGPLGRGCRFCQENDFVTWFELRSRDWDTGEDSVSGQAVHKIVEEIFKRVTVESQK